MNESKSVPEGYFTVTPYLIIKDAVSALDFYKRAFNATKLMCIKDSDGKIRHAEIQIGDSPVMIVEEFPDYPEMPSPQSLGGSPAHIHLFVADVDTIFDCAVINGATIIMPIAEQSEDRRGGIKDPFGHVWWISTRVEDISREELQKRSVANGL
jgi:PhnB protein